MISKLFDILHVWVSRIYRDEQEIYRGMSLFSYTAKDSSKLHLYIRK